MKPVAALYVAADTIYHTFPAVDCWPIDRDATLYPGPVPVVAHPPCGHWGKYSAVCTLPGRHCGPIAIAQVRRWGGLLEHPLGTRLLPHLVPPCSIDFWGGLFVRVDQARFGHPSLKPTLLYVVRCDLPPLPIASTRPLRPLENLSRKARAATPRDFASWLIDAARTARSL